MMKLYQKKSASLEDETVLVHLERRHTLKEDANETDSDGVRKMIRANSLDGFGEGHSSTDVEVVPTEKRSNFTRKPTVITESELASSWLYKDRKAKINSDDESIEDPQPSMSHEDPEDLEPRTLHDPKLKPAPVSNQRSRKMSSCCWYFTIILIICIACLVVLAGVGAIVYLEYFAIYKEKDIENNNASVKNNALSSKENFQRTTHKQNNFPPNEPIIPEDILKDIIKNSTIFTENIEVVRKRKLAPLQKNDIFRNKDQTDTKNAKIEELDMTSNGFVSENKDVKITESSKMVDNSDAFRNIHARFNHFIVPISDKSEELKSKPENQDSIDLNLNLRNVGDTTDIISDGHLNTVNEQMTKDETKITEISISSEETLVPERDHNFDETTTFQGVKLKGEQVRADTSFQTLPEQLPDNSIDHMETSINDNEDNSIDHMKTSMNDNEDNSVNNMENSIKDDHDDNSIDHMEHSIKDDDDDNSIDHMENSMKDDPEDNPFNFRTLAVDHDPEDNSFDHKKHYINPSPKNNTLDHTEHPTASKDSNEDSSDSDTDDSSSDEHSQVDDGNQNSDDSTQLVFIRPVVESKAVPIPLAFLRRIGFDIKNPNSLQPMTAEDMDIKFSLSEALKYLRSLDTENKLPASREKTVSQKTSNPKGSQNAKLPIKSERTEYLNILRKHIFE